MTYIRAYNPITAAARSLRPSYSVRARLYGGPEWLMDPVTIGWHKFQGVCLTNAQANTQPESGLKTARPA